MKLIVRRANLVIEEFGPFKFKTSHNVKFTVTAKVEELNSVGDSN